MEIQSISYQKVFNLGNFSNEKIGIEMKLSPGEDPIDAFAEAKKTVEKSHKFFQHLPAYESAKERVQHPDNYTGFQVKQAAEVIKEFEELYPDYLNKFMPASRTLEQGPVDNYSEYK